MAQIYPDFYTIQHLRQPATEGELILLDFLQKNLNMEFEIYYHPFINGDRPNIVYILCLLKIWSYYLPWIYSHV